LRRAGECQCGNGNSRCLPFVSSSPQRQAGSSSSFQFHAFAQLSVLNGISWELATHLMLFRKLWAYSYAAEEPKTGTKPTCSALPFGQRYPVALIATSTSLKPP
jgi:hypothetical protein